MYKYFISIITVLFFFIISGVYLISQDSSNKFTKSIKDITPVEIKIFIKKTILFVPYSKREIKKLTIELKKAYEKNRKL